MATARTDPRVVESVDLLSGSCHAIVRQHQVMQKDLQRIEQMCHRSGALLEAVVDRGLGESAPTPDSEMPAHELTALLKGALLRGRLLLFKLHENHGKVFVVRRSSFRYNVPRSL